MLTSQSQKVLDLQDYIWLYCASRLQRIFCVLRVQRTCLVTANVVLSRWGRLRALPNSISWIWGATSRLEKERGKGRKERDGRDGRKHPIRNKFLVTVLLAVTMVLLNVDDDVVDRLWGTQASWYSDRCWRNPRRCQEGRVRAEGRQLAVRSEPHAGHCLHVQHQRQVSRRLVRRCVQHPPQHRKRRGDAHNFITWYWSVFSHHHLYIVAYTTAEITRPFPSTLERRNMIGIM